MILLLLSIERVAKKLTATVDPFFPTPPPRIVEKMWIDAQNPHTNVINGIDNHNSIPIT